MGKGTQGQFRPGKAGPAGPPMARGKSGPTDKSLANSGNTSQRVISNPGPTVEGGAQFKPGKDNS